MAKKKIRLDELLVELGWFVDVRAAQGPVMAGDVRIDEVVITKAGALVRGDAEVVVKGQSDYASRGGYKLARALDAFSLDVTGLTVLDAGASTGGFTDCLLKRGAARVHAVDVGFGQLRGRLAADPRVVVYERTNISDLLDKTPILEPIQLCTVDLSYLSLTRAIPILAQVCGNSCAMVCLVKPLYEGLDERNKADPAAIARVVAALIENLAAAGHIVQDLVVSPVLGGRGAIECLALIRGGARNEGAVSALLARLAVDWSENAPG